MGNTSGELLEMFFLYFFLKNKMGNLFGELFFFITFGELLEMPNGVSATVYARLTTRKSVSEHVNANLHEAVRRDELALLRSNFDH